MRLSILQCLIPFLQLALVSVHGSQYVEIENEDVKNRHRNATSDLDLHNTLMMRRVKTKPFAEQTFATDVVDTDSPRRVKTQMRRVKTQPLAEHMLATDAGDVDTAASLMESANAVNASSQPQSMTKEEEQRLSDLVDQWRHSMIKWQTLIVSFSLLFISGGFMRSQSAKSKAGQAEHPKSQARPKGWLSTYLGLPRNRTLGFLILWLFLGAIVAGFGPAYVLKFLGQPWYFDAARQLGPNMLQGWSSAHAVLGAAWLVIMLHQTITAYFGTNKQDLQQAHRMVGRIGLLIAVLCSASGIYILIFGSIVSRIPELQQVVLIGVYASGNALIGILYVRHGQIQAHKQCMAWSIIWSASPGVLRAANYAWFWYQGSHTCPTKCLNLLKTEAPYFCNMISFVSTQCGIGYIIPEISLLLSWGAGIVLWALWGFSHWEILAGNSIGWIIQGVTGDIAMKFALKTIVGHSWINCMLCQ